METTYTKEQVEETQEREKKALAFLKDLDLTPAAIVQKVNLGEDMFVDKVVPYLRDTKYSSKLSPIQNVKPS